MRHWRRGTRVKWIYSLRRLRGTVLEVDISRYRARVGWDDGRLGWCNRESLVEVDAVTQLGELGNDVRD